MIEAMSLSEAKLFTLGLNNPYGASMEARSVYNTPYVSPVIVATMLPQRLPRHGWAVHRALGLYNDSTHASITFTHSPSGHEITADNFGDRPELDTFLTVEMPADPSDPLVFGMFRQFRGSDNAATLSIRVNLHGVRKGERLLAQAAARFAVALFEAVERQTIYWCRGPGLLPHWRDTALDENVNDETAYVDVDFHYTDNRVLCTGAVSRGNLAQHVQLPVVGHPVHSAWPLSTFYPASYLGR